LLWLASIISLAVPSILPRLVSIPAALILLVVALGLIFAGRHIIRVIAFFGVALIFAAASAAIGALLLGVIGFFLGGFFGFIVGAIASFILLPLAIGFATGILAYNLTQNLFHLVAVSAIVGIIFFILGIFLSMKLLSLATAIFGALILFNVLVFFHVPSDFSAAIALVLGAVGFWIQGGFGEPRGTKFVSWSRTPPPASAVSANVRGAQATQASAPTRCPHCWTPIENPNAQFCPNCGASLST
jgi:zinc-ribbon domain